MPIEVTRERFEELVAEALDSIPDGLADYMENVAVVVQDWPTTQQQAPHRGMLLGRLKSHEKASKHNLKAI